MTIGLEPHVGPGGPPDDDRPARFEPDRRAPLRTADDMHHGRGLV